MLDLRDVTLVQIETQEHKLARLAVEDCLAKARFGDILIFTDRPEHFVGLGRVLPAENWPSKLGWSRFSWYGVPPHVRTSHALYIQWDAWIWDASLWRPEFLNYDYIGAPWWYDDGLNVGNGGFSLRSTRLLRYLLKHRDRFPCSVDSDDDLLCRKYRHALEEAGFAWAPEAAARDFAFECVRPSPGSRHFGFHAAFNFGEVLDEDRLAERAKLICASPYIRRTGHIWRGFAERHPALVQQFEDGP